MRTGFGESIVIPASVAVIGKSVLGACRALASVTFEAGSALPEIGEDAFYVIGLSFQHPLE
jgi:hypothetical protein